MSGSRRLLISRGRRSVYCRAVFIAVIFICALYALLVLSNWLDERHMGIKRLIVHTLCFFLACEARIRPLHALMPKTATARYRIRLSPSVMCPMLTDHTAAALVVENNAALVNKSDSLFRRGNNDASGQKRMTNAAYDHSAYQPKQLLIIVQSAPGDRVFRNAVRGTWGSLSLQKQLSMRVLFLLGYSVQHETNVKAEHRKYQDILQVDVVDSYINVTLKVIGAFQWVYDRCILPANDTTNYADSIATDDTAEPTGNNEVRAESRFEAINNIFLLKTDDDMVVDVFRLRSFLDYEWNLFAAQTTLSTPSASVPAGDDAYGVSNFNRTIYCAVHVALPLKPVRAPFDRTSTFYDEWEPEYFPPSCYGGGYGFSLSLLPDLYAGVVGQRYNRHEDILFAGIIVDRLNTANERLAASEAAQRGNVTMLPARRRSQKIVLKTFNKTEFDFWPVHERPSDMLTLGETFYHSIRNIAAFTEQWLYLEQYYRTHPLPVTRLPTANTLRT